MPEIFTYGRFEVEPQNEVAFFDAWSEFAAWASARPGAGTLRLARDVRKAGRFISLGAWAGPDPVQAWKSSPEFKERLGRLVSQAKEFEPTELVPLLQAAGGEVETLSPPADIQPIHAPT